MQSINLIPEQEVQVQSEKKALKFTTIFSLVTIAIIGLVSGFIFYTTYQLNLKIKTTTAENTELRKQISSLAEVEVNARNLDQKFNVLKSIFSTRNIYSMLATEIDKRKPTGIIIDSMTLQKNTKLNVSGHSDNYISIASFTNSLISKTFEGGDPKLKTLFSTVTLNSVSLEKSRNLVTFSINLEMDENLLKRQ